MSIRCNTCGSFVRSSPTYTEEHVSRDFEEFGDPGCDYSVHPVEVLRRREYLICPRCLDETTISDETQ